MDEKTRLQEILDLLSRSLVLLSDQDDESRRVILGVYNEIDRKFKKEIAR